MCYGENGKVKFVETLADNVFEHIYSMMQIKKDEQWENVRVIQVYTLKSKYFLILELETHDFCFFSLC
jgi:hypothetical protein